MAFSRVKLKRALIYFGLELALFSYETTLKGMGDIRQLANVNTDKLNTKEKKHWEEIKLTSKNEEFEVKSNIRNLKEVRGKMSLIITWRDLERVRGKKMSGD